MAAPGPNLAPLTVEIMRVMREVNAPMTIEDIVVHMGEASSASSIRSLMYSLARYSRADAVGQVPGSRADAVGQVPGSRAKLWVLTPKGRTDLHEAEEIAQRCTTEQGHVALSLALGVALEAPISLTKAVRLVDRRMDREPRRMAA